VVGLNRWEVIFKEEEGEEREEGEVVGDGLNNPRFILFRVKAVVGVQYPPRISHSIVFLQ